MYHTERGDLDASRLRSVETLEFAAERGHLEVVKLIVKNQINQEEESVCDQCRSEPRSVRDREIFGGEQKAPVRGTSCDRLCCCGWASRHRQVPHKHYVNDSSAEAIGNAAAIGHLEIVKLLSENRTKTYAPGELDHAARSWHLAVVKFFYDKYQLQSSPSAIDDTAANGDVEMVTFLHHNSMESCITAAMDRVAENGYLQIIEFLHVYRNDRCTADALNLAIMHGNIEVP